MTMRSIANLPQVCELSFSFSFCFRYPLLFVFAALPFSVLSIGGLWLAFTIPEQKALCITVGVAAALCTGLPAFRHHKRLGAWQQVHLAAAAVAIGSNIGLSVAGYSELAAFISGLCSLTPKLETVVKLFREYRLAPTSDYQWLDTASLQLSYRGSAP
eukprot:TRINITY_DN5490_c1_g1_i2.p1 TRINITY_DN5490_c1_g1~~TRINITY_DN5490_c1_g1_i2.p1  ORF type:complete len:158 (-),score=20.08 TRINITY_DN5490_c1_g1_i2:71-544(-)